VSTRLQALWGQYSTDGFAPVLASGLPQLLDGTQTITGPATFYSVPCWVEGMDYLRFVLSSPAGGSAAGTLRLETSIDHCKNAQRAPLATDLQTWVPRDFPVVQADGTTLLQATYPFTAGGVVALDELRVTYLWVRARIDVGAGSFAPVVRWALKGDGGR